MDGENRIGVEGNQGQADSSTSKRRKTAGGIPTVNIPGGHDDNSSTAAADGKTAGGRTAQKEQASQDMGLPIGIPQIPIPAPAKKKSTKTDKDLDKTLESNVRILIGSGFGFATKLTNNPIWEVSDEEAQSISTPLTKILQRLGMNESMNKYADYIALTSALAIVVVPRVIVTQVQNNQNGGTPTDGGKKKKTKTVDTKLDGNGNTTNPPVPVTNIKSLLEVGG